VSSVKPYGRIDTRRTVPQATEVGRCSSCRGGIFSNQPYARVRRPTTGKNHLECVPEGAVVLEVIEP